MLNYSYTPKWSDLLKIIYPFKKKKETKIQKVWCAYDKDILNFFSRSSWSIFLIALLKLKKKTINIWVPSYYCEEALYLLRKLNVNICYYDLEDNFEASKISLQELYKNSKPDLIIFCHFFGKNNFNVYLKDLCNLTNAWLIEDATHCISPNNNIGKNGDFVIYSPYKFMPTPLGAILTVSKKFIKDNDLQILLHPDEQYLLLKKYFKNLNFKKNNNFFFILKWFVKKILTKLSLNFINIKDFIEDQKIIDSNFICNPKIDYFSKNIIFVYSNNIEIEKEKRLRMLFLWKKFIEESIDFKDLDVDLEFFNNDSVPYFAILKDPNKNILKKYHNFKIKKIPILTWPNLPKDINNDSSGSKLRNELIFLPLHNQDMHVIKLIKKRLSVTFIKNRVSFEEIKSKKEWEKFYNSISFSNITQSWEYGEAQKVQYNLKIKRYLINIDNSPKGIIQILNKSFLFLDYYRINRAPLFFDSSKNEDKKAIIFSIFKKFNNYKKFNLLSYSPEINFNKDNIIFNYCNKLFYFQLPSWTSSVVSLTDNEDKIRSNLSSKWRNVLNASLKENVLIKEESNILALKNLIKLNISDQKTKKYKGIKPNLLENYLFNSTYRVFNAFSDDNLISSICISLHGTTATYLIGWSNNDGRKKKSMNLLLWNSILALKKENYQFFDLGGVDKSINSGIFNFKNGIGGKNYKLAGNYDFLQYIKNFNL